MKTKLLFLLALILLYVSHAQVPVNDECVNAIVITDDITTATTISFNNANATESLQSSCDSGTQLDIWYQFDMPVNGNLRFSGINFADGFTLYDNCGSVPTELDCFYSSKFIYNLAIGTYTLRVTSSVASAGADSFVFQALETAVNDDCANAIVITDDITTATTISFNNAAATESLQSTCDTGTQLDLWYQFDMPVNGNLRFSGINFADGFTLYDNCGSVPTELNCFYSNTFIYNLSIGTYTLRVTSSEANSGADSFVFQALETAVNDDCANAIIITDDITSATTISFNNATATESLQSTCDTGTQLDLWYQFNMPVNGNLRFSGINFADGFTLYDNCGSVPTELNCFYSSTFIYNLSIGTYTLRVTSSEANSGADSFVFQALETAVNDDCANAIIITDDITTATTISFNNAAATESLQSTCDTGTQLDLWYQFDMPVNGNLRFSGVNFADGFTLYDNCGSVPTELNCFYSSTFIYNLSIGTYILRVTSSEANSGADSFVFQALETAVNDDCANAIVITDDITTATTISFNNAAATESLQSSCDTGTQLDLWYQFDMPVTGNLEFSGVNFADGFTLYDNCGSVPTELNCFYNDTFIFNLSVGTYTLRVTSSEANSGVDSFVFQAFETVANDECANAIVITDNITTATTISFNNAAATESLQSSCDSGTQQDLWYQFDMPITGNLEFSGVNFADGFTLYDNCGSIPTELDCFYSNSFIYNLAMGTYTLRVTSSETYSGADSFVMQAFPPIVNDDCANPELIQVAGIGLCSNENTTIDLRGASVATSVGSCQNSSEIWHDAWFTFEAPLTGNITLNTNSTFSNFAVYESCGGTEVACFNNDGTIPVIFGQTYLLQIMRRDIYASAATFCLEGAPEVASGTAGACETLPGVTISTTQNNTNVWVPILDVNGNIAAAINANGNDLGVVTTTLFIDIADTRTSSSQPYSRREVSITPTTQPTTNVSIRIYSLEDELTDLIAADSNLNNYFGLDMMRVDGTGCTTGYTMGGNFINSSTTLYGLDYYTSFNANSFSVFYPTSTNLAGTLSVEDFENVLDVSVYPTVSNGIINISSHQNIGEATLSVFDLNGREVFNSNVILGSNAIQINLKNTSKGLYFLKIERNGSLKTQKIILK